MKRDSMPKICPFCPQCRSARIDRLFLVFHERYLHCSAAVAALDALQQDPEVASIVERERIRQLEGAELIASENYTSEAVGPGSISPTSTQRACRASATMGVANLWTKWSSWPSIVCVRCSGLNGQTCNPTQEPLRTRPSCWRA